MVKAPTASQIARAERMRIAAENSEVVRAEVTARNLAIRKNMARLRALRLAKEAEEAARPQPAPVAKRSKTKSKTNMMTGAMLRPE